MFGLQTTKFCTRMGREKLRYFIVNKIYWLTDICYITEEKTDFFIFYFSFWFRVFIYLLPPITKETPSPAATFNITEISTAAGTLLIDTPQNLSNQATGSPTNEAIDNMLEAIEYNSIKGHIVPIEPIIAQKLKSLLENYESLTRR